MPLHRPADEKNKRRFSSGANLIACPNCDSLYQVTRPAPGQRLICALCHKVLIAPRRRAGLHIIAISIAVLILVVGAAFFPFLRIKAGGVTHSASILDAAFAFQGGAMSALAWLCAALILLIPLMRALLLIYVLAPLVADKPAAPHAMQAFRLSEILRPWSMAEIFALGCAVALVKVADLAHLEIGPAFFLCAAFVVLIVIKDIAMDRWSVWNALDPNTDR